MRLTTVATQPFWRQVEAGGAVIPGQHIPVGLNVGSTLYTLHHNLDIFPEPYNYDIERWIPRDDSEEEKVRLRGMNRSYAPFSIGPRQCVAKNFAMMELLLTMANVFWRFDFESVGALGEGGEGLGMGREKKGEFQFKAFFTSHTEGPMIRFKRREGL